MRNQSTAAFLRDISGAFSGTEDFCATKTAEQSGVSVSAQHGARFGRQMVRTFLGIAHLEYYANNNPQNGQFLRKNAGFAHYGAQQHLKPYTFGSETIDFRSQEGSRSSLFSSRVSGGASLPTSTSEAKRRWLGASGGKYYAHSFARRNIPFSTFFADLQSTPPLPLPTALREDPRPARAAALIPG